jgi:hypothetical protein
MPPWIALALAGGLALAGIGCLRPGRGEGFLSDAAMIAKLRTQRASFDSLVTMLDKDRKIRAFMADAEYADTGGTYQVMHTPHADLGSIPGERWDAYARLLTRTGAGRNVDNGAEGILLTQWAQGSYSNKAWIRGYYYARRALPRGSEVLVADLSAESTYGRPPWPTRSLDRHVDGRWYLYSLRRFPG